jgi:glycosyltransferase involved in cell wall biosynthesis
LAATSPWADIYLDHPIPAAVGVDPLDAVYPSRSDSSSRADQEVPQLRIGYAAVWDRIQERTWSGSSWHLRDALRQIANVSDIGVQYPLSTEVVFKAMHTRFRNGRLTTSWYTSRLTDAYISRALRRGIRENFGDSGYDAAIMIDSLAILPEPCFTYFDCSWDLMMASAVSLKRYAQHRRITPANAQRRRDLQVAIYEKVTGIFVESHWQARSLIEQSGISPAKIHVAPPAIVAGRNSRDPHAPSPHRLGPRRKLLFVGRMYEPNDFYRKGGDLVVKALTVLRREYDPQMTLTVVGMDEWPLPGSIPDGVNFRGVLSPAEVAKLYDSHDLLVMPSRLEPFGLVFAEALARGMPCVARNACAMPEIVTPGVSGALIDKDDEHELAATIISVLNDDEIYSKCRDRAPRIAEYFTWERTADDMVHVISAAAVS